MSIRHYLYDVGPKKPIEPTAVGSYSTAPLNSVSFFTPQLVLSEPILSDLKLQGLDRYIQEARTSRNLDIDAAAPINVQEAYAAMRFITSQLGARGKGGSSKSDHSLNVEMSALAGYSIAAALDPSLPPDTHRPYVGKQAGPPSNYIDIEIRRPVEGPVEVIEVKDYGVGESTLTKLIQAVQSAPNGFTMDELFRVSRPAGQVLIKLLCALHWPPAPAPPIRHGCIGSALLWLDVYLFTSTNPNNPSEPAKSTVLLGPLQQMDRLRPSFPSSVAYALLQPTKPLSLPQKTMDIISFAHEAPKRVFVIPSKKNKKKDAGEAAAGEADTSRPQLDVARVAAAEVFDHWAKGSGVQNVEELCNSSSFSAFMAPELAGDSHPNTWPMTHHLPYMDPVSLDVFVCSRVPLGLPPSPLLSSSASSSSLDHHNTPSLHSSTLLTLSGLVTNGTHGVAFRGRCRDGARVWLKYDSNSGLGDEAKTFQHLERRAPGLVLLSSVCSLLTSARATDMFSSPAMGAPSSSLSAH